MTVNLAHIERIFTEALTHANQMERHRFLSSACGQDAGLWNAVWDRLRNHFGKETGHGPAAAKGPSTGTLTMDGEKPGDVLDGCHLLQIVGEAPSTVVWMAERHVPEPACVAVKIINTGANDFLMRHATARQSLVTLDHPAIARVHGSGMTSAGKPFIVTDLGAGVPILQFCDDQKLMLSARVRLFLQVCEAVHHAHEKGVAHGDLKSGNILVRWSGEGEPVFALTDFGFVQAMGPAVLTPDGRLRTPVAALAPELVGTGKATVQGDILALGALLFELITGRQPFTAPPVLQSLEELRRITRETPPLKPSECLNALPKAQLTGVALGRRTDPARLVQLMEVHFDSIVMRALQKQAHARQDSLLALAEPLLAYLKVADEEEVPVTQAESKGHSHFREHRKLFALAAALVLLLTAAIAVLGWLWVRNDKAPEQAATLKKPVGKESPATEFLTAMFAGLTPERIQGKDTTLLKGMLDDATGRLDMLKDHPEDGAQMQETIGLTYLAMSENGSAQKQFQGALDKRQNALGSEHPDTLRSMRQMAEVFHKEGHHPEAETLLRKTLGTQQRVLGANHPDTFVTITVLAAVCEAQDRPMDSQDLFVQLWKLQKRILGPDHMETLSTMGNLAGLMGRQGQHEEAIQMEQERLDLTKKKHGARDSRTLAAMTITAAAYEAGGQPSEAEKLYVGALEVMKQALGPTHPDTLEQMDKTALLQRKLGRPRDALKLHQESLEARRRTLGAGHPDTLMAMRNVAEDLEADGQKSAAEGLQLNVLDVLRNSCGPEHADTLEQSEIVAETYARHGRHADAVSLHQQVLQGRRHALGNNHPQTLRSMAHVAGALAASGRTAEAETMQAEVLKCMKSTLGPGDPDTLAQMQVLAQMQEQHGQAAQAEKTWVEIIQLQQKALGKDHPDTLGTLQCLAHACQLQGRLPEAEKIYREVLNLERARKQPDSARLADCAGTLGRFWLQQNRAAEAEPLLRESLALLQKHQPNDWHRFSAESLLGDALLGLKRLTEAGPLLRSGHDGLNTRIALIPKAEHFHLRDAIERMGRFVELSEGAAAAAEWRHKLAAFDQLVQLARN